MFGKPLSQRSKLDKAVFASVAAMLAMNVFVLAQQMDRAPTIAAADQHAAAQQV
ncbi:MAG: hypothetical protein ACKOW1_07300 [Novosphingobium sp.]